ncbi:GAF domain-containing protein [Sporosarcina highlanderae]|uniref:GAF domain-containing protein n=1 Tax=Sporosarcina highlanderae TaxID=3035916 RepID=A0ABT8JLV5_9BACL|nr:GAF domain-containing protein [Sporosarcina highlanderae]MDN4606131.1 GAF domain-containing protein [Sporosarcina highlanderae]
MKEWVGFNFQREIERVREAFGFDYVGIALVQSPERGFELKWAHVTGNKSERHRRIKLQSGKGVAGLVFKTGKPIYVGDALQEVGTDSLFNYPIIVAEGLKSFGAIPLYKSYRVNGVILVGYRKNQGLTLEQFEEFKREIGTGFGPFYDKEMVSDESVQQ